MRWLTQIVLLIILITFLTVPVLGQTYNEASGKTLGSEVIEFKDPPHLRLASTDSVNGKPLYDYFIYIKAKLNGVYDINGGIYGETFNVGAIPVWENDDQKRFWMDMHQSQVRFRGQMETEHGTYTAYMEGDYWGGNKHFRLRHMWFEYKFAQLSENWAFVGHIGQDWSFFGDKEIWPNVFDWDGPSSGVWRREPELRFWFENQKGWRLEFGAAQPGAELYFINDVDPTLEEAKQPLPDFIAAINKKYSRGHFRLTGIYRNLEYRKQGSNMSEPGYGISLSGYISTNQRMDNPIQFQLVAGTGIATYLVSYSGMNYDAVPDGSGRMKTIPTIGGWVSYEHWFSEKWHANVVAGFSNFKSEKISRFDIVDSPGYTARNTSAQLEAGYFLVNFMWNPIPSLTIGAEWNWGKRTNIYEGLIDTGSSVESKVEKSRSANRISFGAFFNF